MNPAPALRFDAFPRALDWAPDGSHLAWDRSSRFLASGGGSVVTVWDVHGQGPAGTRPGQFEGHEDRVSALHWQPAGEVLASGARDGSVWLWKPGSTPHGLPAARLPAAVVALAWSPAGTRLAVASADGALVVAG
jgi:WD40 repeat protein